MPGADGKPGTKGDEGERGEPGSQGQRGMPGVPVSSFKSVLLGKEQIIVFLCLRERQEPPDKWASQEYLENQDQQDLPGLRDLLERL